MDSLESTGSPYLCAAEATRLLNVKPQTLYTYVSRGLIRAIHQTDRKEKLYSREDVERVRLRGMVRSGTPGTPESTARWTQPVIQTAITEITAAGPIYRGKRAIDLARDGVSFEATASLLWTGVLPNDTEPWDPEPLPAGFGQQLDTVVLPNFRVPTMRPPVLRANLLRAPSTRPPGTRPPILRVFSTATTLLGATENGANEIRRGTTIQAARQLVQTLAGCLGYLGPTPSFRFAAAGSSIAADTARVLLPNADRAAITAIDAALVLAADHELSPATFAARIAASAGAELRSCVLAAIATHSGATLAGICDRVEDALREAESADALRDRLAGIASGFSATAYPGGDPRARRLLELARKLPGERAARALQLIDDVERRFDVRPNIELGLAALAASLGLPERSAGAIWALGRTAGWIAHVLEQRLAGFSMRPRGRYAVAALRS